MIDVWLKIRDRGNLEFLLKHLNFWISTFSDTNKYKIYLYNENVNLPAEYNCFEILTKQKVLSNPNCKKIFDTIQNSRISPKWKGAAFALTAPYFYLKDSEHEYILNIDADDAMFGSVATYIDKCILTMREHNLPTLSYDYIFSYNLFEENHKRMMPHHWTFGVNISHKNMMQSIISNVLNNILNYCKYIPNVDPNNEINIDILISSFFVNEGRHYKYYSFATEEGMRHRGFGNFNDVYWCYIKQNEFTIEFRNRVLKRPKHEKSIFIA